MNKCILFIDGENFLHKVKEILKIEGRINNQMDLSQIDLNKLFLEPLKGLKLQRKIYYASKINLYPETQEKSKELIDFQRRLRNHLVKIGYEFIVAGNVRPQQVGKDIVFREKGVEVKIAVDMVSMTCDKNLDCAVLCSSDSDLQPAVKEIRRRKTEVIYLGFESNPNKGLSYTTSRTILLRNPEVLAACPKKANIKN